MSGIARQGRNTEHKFPGGRAANILIVTLSWRKLRIFGVGRRPGRRRRPPIEIDCGPRWVAENPCFKALNSIFRSRVDYRHEANERGELPQEKVLNLVVDQC
jgi:hypothetical protein